MGDFQNGWVTLQLENLTLSAFSLIQPESSTLCHLGVPLLRLRSPFAIPSAGIKAGKYSPATQTAEIQSRLTALDFTPDSYRHFIWLQNES